MASRQTKEQLERMRKAAQEKRRAEGGKLATDAVFRNSKRTFYSAFKSFIDTESRADVNATDEHNGSSSAHSSTKTSTAATPSTSGAQLHGSARPKKATLADVAVNAATTTTTTTITTGTATLLDGDSASGCESTSASNDIWASMTARKLDDELPAEISEMDERLVNAWKRKHYYELDHDGTPVNDTCICGLLKPCCLALLRMVERYDQLKSNLNTNKPSN